MYPGVGFSLVLLAIGAVLAFAVNLNSTGVDLNTVGAILMIVGLIGLLLSFLAFADFPIYPRRRHYAGGPYDEHDDERLTPPHEHRRSETTDVVYEDEHGPHTERVRRRRA